MKLTISRLFDVAQVATKSAYKDLQPFVDNQVSVNDNLYNILLKNVSLADNIAGTTISIDLKHNVPTQIQLTKVPVGVVVLKSYPLTPFPLAVNFEQNSNGQYNVIAHLSNALYEQPVKVTLYFFHN